MSFLALLLTVGLDPEPARAAEAGTEPPVAAQDVQPSAEAAPPGEASVEDNSNKLKHLLERTQKLVKAGRHAEAEALVREATGWPPAEEWPWPGELERLLGRTQELLEAGRYAEAEAVAKEVIARAERERPEDQLFLAESLNNLASVYWTQGRYADAELLLQRALAISEKVLGPDHPGVAIGLQRLAGLYQDQGRYAEAEPLYQRALANSEKAPRPDHSFSAIDLARLYLVQGRYAEAEPLYQKDLADFERVLGPNHHALASILDELAKLYLAQGRLAEAEPLYQRALANLEEALGPDNPDVAQGLFNLAVLYLAQGRLAEALSDLRRASAIRTAPANRSSVAHHRATFYWHAYSALAAAGRTEPTQALAAEAFVASQWPQQGQAAQALAQMGARTSKGDTALAELVRRYEGMVEQHRRADRALIAALGEVDQDKHAPAWINGLRQEANRLNTELQALDAELRERFAEYADLASPQPLPYERVQALLGEDETLITFLVGTQDFALVVPKSFVFVVDREGIHWGELPSGEILAKEVTALRRGLALGDVPPDPTAASQRRPATAHSRDDGRGGTQIGEDGRPLYADNLMPAHELYRQLLGPVEAHLKAKRHWIIVPDGVLTGLPFQLLLTASPQPDRAETEAYRQAPWLIREHALTVLPAVSSLRVLRELGRDKRPAPEPFIGFGDPVIGTQGPLDCDEAEGAMVVASRAGPAAGVRRAAGVETASLFGSGARPEGLVVANVEAVRGLRRLPDTRCELETLARRLGARPEAVHLAEKATESQVKALSETGELARYRTIAFATHGLTADEGRTMRAREDPAPKALPVTMGAVQVPTERDEEVAAEPALVLTPPEQGTVVDDGLLTASEVAELQLNAEWVLLSACNTASGAGAGAESLSGLAKAFFYAGGASLLVSHWPVDSDAAVRLTTGSIQALALEPEIGRAEALRRAMLAFLISPNPRDVHPRRWAPFTLVGEGGAPAETPSHIEAIKR